MKEAASQLCKGLRAPWNLSVLIRAYLKAPRLPLLVWNAEWHVKALMLGSWQEQKQTTGPAVTSIYETHLLHWRHQLLGNQMDKLVLNPYWLRWTSHWDSAPAWLAKCFLNLCVCGVSSGRLGRWVCCREETWRWHTTGTSPAAPALRRQAGTSCHATKSHITIFN